MCFANDLTCSKAYEGKLPIETVEEELEEEYEEKSEAAGEEGYDKGYESEKEEEEYNSDAGWGVERSVGSGNSSRADPRTRE